MLKRITLLAVAAAAFIAVASPATGTAAVWTHEGVPLTSDAEITFTGQGCFSTAVVGYCSTIEIDVVLESGVGSGYVREFSSTDCAGTGQLSGLVCTETPNGNWHVEANGDGTFTFHDIEVHKLYFHPQDVGHTTPLATSTLSGDIRATPDHPSAISSVTLEGLNTVESGNPASYEGELEATPAGIYGMG